MGLIKTSALSLFVKDKVLLSITGTKKAVFRGKVCNRKQRVAADTVGNVKIVL